MEDDVRSEEDRRKRGIWGKGKGRGNREREQRGRKRLQYNEIGKLSKCLDFLVLLPNPGTRVGRKCEEIFVDVEESICDQELGGMMNPCFPFPVPLFLSLCHLTNLLFLPYSGLSPILVFPFHTTSIPSIPASSILLPGNSFSSLFFCRTLSLISKSFPKFQIPINVQQMPQNS